MRILGNLILFLILFAAASLNSFAQQNRSQQQTQLPRAADASNGSTTEITLSPYDRMLENKAKMMLRAAEKEHEELLTRALEVARLSGELKNSFKQSGKLGGNDAEKLTQMEKSVKKVRKSLGGSDDDEEEFGQPASLAKALERLAEIGGDFHEKLKESSRHTLSADSIENANELLKLIGYIRNSAR